MTIFDFVNDILYKKKGDLFSDPDADSIYSPYMINRWVSMYSAQCCQMVNATSNVMSNVLSGKRDHYVFMVNMIPRQRFRKIEYVKKNKKKDTIDPDVIKACAHHLELSVREMWDISRHLSPDVIKLIEKTYS